MADDGEVAGKRAGGGEGVEGGGGSGGGGDAKRRKYHAGAMASKDAIRGEPGLLVTCHPGKERQCAREVLSLLDECCPAKQGEKDGSHGGGGGKKSISDRLAEELDELRDTSKRSFYWHRLGGVSGVVFVHFCQGCGWNPLDAVEAIVADAVKTRRCKSKWISRFVPVETSCFCDIEDIKKMAQGFVAKHFPEKEKESASKVLKFAVEFEHRASNKYDRMVVIDAFAKQVPQPPYSVSLKKPDVTVLVQNITNKCFVGLARGYKDSLKFNLRRLVERGEERHGEREEEEGEGKAKAEAEAEAK